MDQAAIAAAPFLRFYPAVDRGRPVGTWVRFDLEFTGLPEGALAFPETRITFSTRIVSPIGKPPDCAATPGAQ